MKTELIKIVLIIGLGATLRAYLVRAQSTRRDRILGIGLCAGLVGTLLYPQATTWVAQRMGVGRGADLVFYLAIVALLFFIVVLNGYRQAQDRTLTELTREIALLRWELEVLKGSSRGPRDEEAPSPASAAPPSPSPR
jgi:hypothetical protein